MITSTSNAKVKRLVNLAQKSKLRRSEGVFTVEGMKMFLEAPDDWIKEVYISESLMGKKHPDRLEGVNYEVVSDEVFKKISDTQTPQGVLCVMKMPVYKLADMLQVKNKAPLLMILEDIQDPGNLGTIIRAGEGAGIDGIIMTKNTVDIFNPKVIRSTMGSIYRIPFLVTDDISKVINELKASDITVYAAHLDESIDYDNCDYTKGTAFLIGNEGNGLKRETADMADRYIKIPMKGQVESLNAAMASVILMYEAAAQIRRK